MIHNWKSKNNFQDSILSSTVDFRNQTQVIRFVWHLAGLVNMVLMRKPDIPKPILSLCMIKDKAESYDQQTVPR